jgi:hypothetical protein
VLVCVGCDAKGKPIAEADEIPVECGVMVNVDDPLAKAVPVQGLLWSEDGMLETDL